jgi:signal transduction histidine kinase
VTDGRPDRSSVGHRRGLIASQRRIAEHRSNRYWGTVEKWLRTFTTWLVLSTTCIGVALPGRSLAVLAIDPLGDQACVADEPGPIHTGELWQSTPRGVYHLRECSERVRFGPRFEGWQVVRTRREALYTDREPGPYTFRVATADADGVGTSRAAVLDFRLQSAFFQYPRCQFLCVALSPALLMGVYLLTLKQVQARYRQSLRTRCRERKRVARDLHDTLLQGIQALLFRLQDWEADPALPEVLRAEVAGVVTQAIAVVTEGRERILNLRGRECAPADLISALSTIGEDESEGTDAAFQLRIQGRQRSLTTDAKQQLFDIGREAIRNAYAHARAKRITVTVEYRWRTLRLEIRDNGQGFDPVVSEQIEGHFGLLGMRERAAELHGALSITRLSEGGTTVSVTVPAGIAYSDGSHWVSKRRPIECHTY